ncbi:MAG: hypothetical protein ACTSU5_07255 [Promethearchaeota archaeon]
MVLTNAERSNFFETFKGIIDSVLAEKRQSEKSAKKLAKLKARVNIALRCTEDDVVYVNLIFKGGDYEVNLGKIDDYDLELAATPEDMMFFTNGTYSTVDMLTKKNKYGDKRLKIKKGGRKALTLLKVSSLLRLD